MNIYVFYLWYLPFLYFVTLYIKTSFSLLNDSVLRNPPKEQSAFILHEILTPVSFFGSYRSCWALGAAGRAESCSVALSVLPFFPEWMDEEVKRTARNKTGRPTCLALLLSPGSPRPSPSSPHPPPLPPYVRFPRPSSCHVRWTAVCWRCWRPPGWCPCLPLLFLCPHHHPSRRRQRGGRMTRWERGLRRRRMHPWVAHSSRRSGRRSACSCLARNEAKK